MEKTFVSIGTNTDDLKINDIFLESNADVIQSTDANEIEKSKLYNENLRLKLELMCVKSEYYLKQLELEMKLEIQNEETSNHLFINRYYALCPILCLLIYKLL
jgi:hypothetical protein